MMAQVLVPCTHVEVPDEDPGSWLLAGPALAIVTFSEMNQQMEDLCLCFPPVSVKIYLLNKNKYFFKKLDGTCLGKLIIAG